MVSRWFFYIYILNFFKNKYRVGISIRKKRIKSLKSWTFRFIRIEFLLRLLQQYEPHCNSVQKIDQAIDGTIQTIEIILILNIETRGNFMTKTYFDFFFLVENGVQCVFKIRFSFYFHQFQLNVYWEVYILFVIEFNSYDLYS